jgi:hypothetical protein
MQASRGSDCATWACGVRRVVSECSTVLLVAVKLRSPSGSLAPCVMTEARAHPQRLAAQPREVYCAGQRWLQGPGSPGWWGTVAVLVSCHRPCVVAHLDGAD